MPSTFRRLGAGAALALALAGCAGPAPTSTPTHEPAPDLVPLHTLAPTVQQDMRYFGSHNFMGRRVAGYEAPRCWLSRPAAQALAAVQRDLASWGLGLKVFDCYRPQAAVDDFVRWGADLSDQRTKAEYYPRVPKSELFARGYIAERSGHSRASTVDLSLVVLDAAAARTVLLGPIADGHEIDMGTPFDLFDERSHTDNPTLGVTERHNRQWLRAVMQRHGWRNLPEEWWHYTLQNEPYPDRYFKRPVR
ncbi:MAG: M15 family metallopeptidase [Proteobacteria bacterium]|nr:M15 family metallopeptidase [Pseudomonadota bacterium]MBS0415809.1 M15 family metallopeptidase [Pseudomonadota bacterium]